MFSPDAELLHIFNQLSYRFHATIGLDPLGDFQEIDGLNYEVPIFEYKELGRNHGAVRLPFEGPATTGELTLKWGLIVRSKMYEWMHDVKLGKDFLKDVWIFQLSPKAIPLRIYHLSGCWPTKWESGSFSASGPAEMATETLTLAYDNIDMANLSALAMLGDLVDEPVAELVEKLRPKRATGGVARDAQHQRTGLAGVFGARVVGEAPRPLSRTRWSPLDTTYAADEAEERETFEEDYEADAGEIGPVNGATVYKGRGRSHLKKALEDHYKAVGGDPHADPLAEDYVAVGGDGTGEVGEGAAYVAAGRDSVFEVGEGDAYEAVGADSVVAIEGLKTEKEEGDA
jgi:phage tail-like protein